MICIIISGISRLVEFASASAASAAVTLLNGLDFNGRAIHLRLDRSHSDDVEGGYKIFIGNLPWTTTEENLITLFSSFAPSSCSVLTNMYGRSRGFAIMQFQSEVNASDAIKHLNGHEVEGRKIEVS